MKGIQIPIETHFVRTENLTNLRERTKQEISTSIYRKSIPGDSQDQEVACTLIPALCLNLQQWIELVWVLWYQSPHQIQTSKFRPSLDCPNYVPLDLFL